MKRNRLDPSKPRKLTAAELRRLDSLPIDFSDIPKLGDEFFTKATRPWPPEKGQICAAWRIRSSWTWSCKTSYTAMYGQGENTSSRVPGTRPIRPRLGNVRKAAMAP